MGWLIFALISSFIFALTTLIDGISVKNYIKNSKVYLFYCLILQGFLGLFIILFKPISFVSYSFAFISLLTGFFYVYGLIPYIKSLEFEEVSRIAPLFNLAPIFILIFSIVIFGLKLSISQYIGFILLILGGFMISVRKVKGLFKISRGFWYMVLTNLLLAGYFIGTGYLFGQTDYWNAFFFIQFGISIAALSMLFFKNYGQKGIKELRNIKKIGKILVLVVSLLGFIAVGIRNTAISMSSATLVSSLNGLQSLFLFITVLILSIRSPKLLKEEINRKVILLKIVSIILFIIGIYLISR